MQTTTIRPGYLVSLKTTVSGNVTYRRQDIEAERTTEDGAKLSKWQTEKTIRDAAELESAIKIRGKCRSLIGAICSASDFGLLCPESRLTDLNAAITEAQQLARDFNRTANLTRITVYAITGFIAQDDAQAVKAINSEIRGLIETMEAGLESLDVEKVRDAANRARNLGQMLSPEAESRIKTAIDAARTAARKIVKAGEAGAVEIDRATLRTIAESRTAFLDLDDAAEIAAPTETGRAMDFEPIPTSLAASAAYSAPQLEF